MKHIKERHRLRRRVAPVLAVAVAAAGLVVVNTSTSSAATPTSGERIVSWKRVLDDGPPRIDRAADLVAPSGQRFVTAIPNSNRTVGVLGLTDQGQVVVGGTPQFEVPQPVLDQTIADLGVDPNGTLFTAVTQAGTVYAWTGSGVTVSPAGTCDAASAAASSAIVGVVCTNGSVEMFALSGGTVPSYFTPPASLSGVTDLALTSARISSATRNVAVAVNDRGQAVRWGDGITGQDTPPRTSGKTLASIESRNALTADGAIVSFSDAPRHDIPVDEGGLAPATAAEGFVSVSSNLSTGFGITTSGRFASWGDNTVGANDQVLRSLPSGLSDARFVDIAANSNQVAAVVADSDEPTGPQISSPSTITGATDGLVRPGSILSGTPATFSGSVTTTTDWLTDGEVIASATGSQTLLVTAAMLDQDLTFRTQATGGGLTSPLSSVSAPVKVTNAVPHTVVSQAAITGSPASGLTLTGTPATFDSTPDTVSNRWFADDVEITTSRNATTLLLTDEEVGKKITFQTRASYDADESAAPTVSTSEPTRDIRVALSGTAVITGDPVVGNTLKAEIDWTDDSPDLTVRGTWVDADTFDPIAEGTSYTLTKADLGKRIEWLGEGSRYPDETGFAYTDFAGVGPVTAAQLAITGSPTISGSPFIGGTLTAAPAPVSDADADVALTWFVGGEATDTTGTTYTPVAADAGKTVTVRQVASLDGATTGTDFASAESAPTAAVSQKPADLSVESEATISGTPLEGRTLTGNPAEFAPTEDVTVANFWVIDGQQTAATGTTLTLGASTVGKSIQFRSVATRGDDTLSSTSEAVGPVIAQLTSTTRPTIAGKAEVGQTLAGTPGGFSASEGVTRENFWVVDGEQQPATGSLALTDELEGTTITFRSVATRGDETVTSTSDPVGPVTKPAPPEPVADVTVLLDGATAPGATFSVRVGEDFVGDTVSVSTASPTRELGEARVAVDGTIEVTLPGDMLLGNQTLTVRQGSTTLGSDSYTVDLTRPDGEAGKDVISVNPDPVAAGADALLTVGQDFAGDRVRVVAFSDATMIGFSTLAESGTASITIPASLKAGEHRMAVYGEDGELIGYTDFTVAATAGEGDGDGAGNGGGDGATPGTGTGTTPGAAGPISGGALPATGADLPAAVVPAALLMVLLGLGLVVAARDRRQRPMH